MLDILLVEDDCNLAKAVVDYLTIKGMQCDHALHGIAALSFAKENRYDVIVLDLNLPKMNGLEVCESLREYGVDTPVIMLTARDMLEDKLKGFESGADDYMVKPFSLEELVARIMAHSKRPSGQARKLQVGNLVFDLSMKKASVNSQVLKLSPTAANILEILIRESPNIVAKERICHMIWGDEQPDSNNLKVHIYALRKGLAEVGATPTIKTTPYTGFALKP